MPEFYRAWTEEDRDHLEKYLDEGMSIDQIATIMERTPGSVHYETRRMALESTMRGDVATAEKPVAKTKQVKAAVEEKAAEFIDQRMAEKSRDGIWKAVLSFQKELSNVRIQQPSATIKIDTDKWIGIAFQGDLHLGNMATDYDRLLKDKKIIREADNLYLVINGDYCDNYISGSHMGGNFEALFPPAVQKDLAKDYIESIRGKVLALVAGCHDIWSQKVDDFDLTEYLAKHGQAVYLGNGGDLFLQLPGHTYKIKMRHKYRFNSGDNATATVKKMFEKEGGFDVGVVSHNHVAAMEECVKMGLDGLLKRIFLRSGSYKTTDRYSSQMGFGDAQNGVPVVLFNPRSRDIRGFEDLAEGVAYLNYLNKGSK